jgi:bacterioferritin (cytochrome b1)
MNLQGMIDLLNNDLKNEWKHLHFYLTNASLVSGLHAHEYKEFLLESAAGEMKHVTAFSDLIIGLGGSPTTEVAPFKTSRYADEILNAALKMEDEVVANYVQRQKDAQELAKVDPVNGGWIDVFLDGQIQDSREDADHLRRITY